MGICFLVVFIYPFNQQWDFHLILDIDIDKFLILINYVSSLYWLAWVEYRFQLVKQRIRDIRGNGNSLLETGYFNMYSSQIKQKDKYSNSKYI